MTRWWQSRRALAAAMLIATAPLWFVRLPPQIDLLGHMGRYRLQIAAASEPLLAAHWAIHWHWIGNLGGDLLMLVLAPLVGAEAGARILSGLVLAVMLAGMARLARAAHGRIPGTAWAAFPFAMAYPWHYGLINYWLGIALGLNAAASFWHPWRGRTLAAALVALLLWTAHIFGWALFVTLIVARQIGAGIPPKGSVERRRAVSLVAALGAPLVVMLVQRATWRGPSPTTLEWFHWGYKIAAFGWTLRDQNMAFDLACLGAAVLLIALGFTARAFTSDPSLRLAALLLLVDVALLPYQLLGSAFADCRLWPVVLIIALLALRPRAEQTRLDTAIAAGAALLFAVRIAVTGAGFLRYDAAYARHLAALDQVPRGARIAVLVDFPCATDWRRERIEHLDGLAIVRRDAFTNGQWDVPGAQLVEPLAARGTTFNSDPSELLFSCGDPRPGLARRLAELPRERFDFVWLLAYPPATLPPYPGLAPMFADDRTILYRIVR